MSFLSNTSLRLRIYFAITMVTLMSFLIIGAATIWYTKSENEKYHRDRLARKERAIEAAINYYLEDKEGDPNTFYTKNFHEKIMELSDIHKLELTLFDLNGKWFSSSHFEYFDQGLLPDTLSQTVLNDLSKSSGKLLASKKYNNEEYIYSLLYIRNNENEPLAIVNIPYFTSDQVNKEETSRFLWTLVKVYGILLLAGLIIAYFLSNSITHNLRIITNRINSMSLSKENEELKWDSKDEIGSLVKAYNEKVRELEKSAQLLAQSERESAWREMAKQVAHEIKNPLTPMLLQVQQLERSWKDGKEDFKDRISRFNQTMTEQIETLSRIANEFSTFAELPNAKIEEITLQDSILKVVDLFKDPENYQILYEIPEKPCVIHADKDQIMRILTNLIKNAIQAFKEDEKGVVEIELSENNHKVILSITDNGVGIRESQLEHIFEPNFTTKSGGAGLGLAMVKSMLTQAKGEISVISKIGFGSTFIINLPSS